MLRLGGHILTLIYFIAVFFTATLPHSFLYFADIAGILAFTIFALLLARGLMYTENVFKYFVRLCLTAFITQLIITLIEHYQNLSFIGSNALFTFSAAIGFLVGLSLALTSSYMLVLKLQISEGDRSKMKDYYKTFQPGNYNLPPWAGLALGLACMLLSLYASWRMDFTLSIYGILLVTCFYLAFVDFSPGVDVEDDYVNRPKLVTIIRKSIFNQEKNLFRAFIYLLTLNVLRYAIEMIVGNNAGSPTYFFSLLILIPAALIPHHKKEKKSSFTRFLRYAIFPVMLTILALIRYFLVLS